VEHAAQQLQRRGLAGAVGAEEAHHLAGPHPERDRAHGRHLSVPAADERSRGGGQAGLAQGHAVGHAQPAGEDGRLVGVAPIAGAGGGGEVEGLFHTPLQ
jgi:hypothetical protein